LGVIYSRGCPFRCSFCINSTLKGINSRIRYHDVDHAIYDITRLIEEYNADGITIHDDHFLLNEDRVIAFCEKVISKKIKANFRASGRIDSLYKLSNNAFRLLRKAGFLSINSGIESGSLKILSLLNKNITLEQIFCVDKKLSKHGFYKHWNFMTALPGETIEDVSQTLYLIACLAKTCLNSPYPFSYRKYTPLLKTELFEWSVGKFGLKIPETLKEWGDFSQRFVGEREHGKLDLVLRPWMSEDTAKYTIEGGNLIEQLNCLYTGKDADRQKIEFRIKELEELSLRAAPTNIGKCRFIGAI